MLFRYSDVLLTVDMRRDTLEIFITTLQDKKMMLFSTTISKDIHHVCKRFMENVSEVSFDFDSIQLRIPSNMIYCDISSFKPLEVYVDDEVKLALLGLVQVWNSTCLMKLTFPLPFISLLSLFYSFLFCYTNIVFYKFGIVVGFYICWRFFVWVPSVYTSSCMYFFNHHVHLRIQVTHHSELC